MYSFLSSRRAWLVVGIVLLLFIGFFHTPKNFVSETLVAVPSGSSFSKAADALHEAHIITSPLLLRIAIIATGGTDSVKAGDYYFKEPLGVLGVAWRLSHGRHGLLRVRVLLPEGSSSKDMGELLSAKLSRVDADGFAREARSQEGYLFPDTYFFLPTATSGDVIAVLRQTFDEKTAGIVPASSTVSFPDAVVMASILEEEAQTPEDRRIIAGILWKRLDAGQRLQVDAPFMYLFGKASHELTQDDLAYDSPYNTYVYEGLPPSPIANAGLDALLAAYDPEPSPYWFYLSDGDGVMHYAETFEEHKANKARYLQ